MTSAKRSTGQNPAPADLLVLGGAVLTLDAADTVYPAGAVAVRDGRIVAVGPRSRLVRRFRARRAIEAAGQLVLPGLVNAHTHAAMTLFRGLSDDQELITWLTKYMFPLEAKFVRTEFAISGRVGAQLRPAAGHAAATGVDSIDPGRGRGSGVAQLSREQFREADKYAAYLRSTEGRLRADLGWTNLRGFLPVDASGCCVLDVGGGSGTLALRLAELGFEVALLDSSEPMLAVARKEAGARELRGRISFHQGDAVRLSDLFEPSSFHAVVCHNLLEYVEDPFAVLRGLVQLLKRDGKSVISLLVRNRWGEVLKAAIKRHDPELARAALLADTVLDSLYGQPVRVFDAGEVCRMVEQAGLELLALRGVRVVSDYVGCEALTEDEYRRLFEFELLLGAQPQLAAVARYTQLIARAPSKPAGAMRK
jgi:2-polyprenyl-3-methyl-5-hydroxy-6-metoxy-1,4-benzoquinol methylase